MKKIGIILSYVLIIAVIVGVIGFIVVFTNGGTTDFKTFYVNYDGKMILQDTEKQLPANKELTFEVKYTFDKVTNDTKDFYVSVIAYTTDDNDFEYKADGETVLFSASTDMDFSKCFGLVKTGSGFTMNIPYDITMKTCLASVNTGKTIAVDNSVDMTQTAYFAVKVVSYNEKSTILIPFTVYKGVADIILTPDGELIY